MAATGPSWAPTGSARVGGGSWGRSEAAPDPLRGDPRSVGISSCWHRPAESGVAETGTALRAAGAAGSALPGHALVAVESQTCDCGGAYRRTGG